MEVATQLSESAEPGDEVAITTLFKAAETLGATDPGVAADLSQRALELAARRHPLRGPLVAKTTVWLHAAGRGEEAKSVRRHRAARSSATRAGSRGPAQHRGNVRHIS